MTPQVSVVLPTFNRARTIPRAVRSVLAQSFRELELIVVDDGSTDCTESVVAAIEDPRLRYVRRPSRGGVAAARNTGVAAARAPLIAFQDSDDEWLAEKLEKQARVLAESPAEVGMSYCGLLRWNGRYVHYLPSAANYSLREGDVRRVVPRQNLAPPQAWLVRRECFDRIGMFDDGLEALEDWEWLLRFSREFEVRLIDEPLLVAHESADSLSLDHRRLAQALTRIIGKHEAHLKADSPAGLSYLHFLAGLRRCLLNEMQLGRASLLRAISIRPWDARFWGVWLISLAGRRALEAAWRANRRARALA